MGRIRKVISLSLSALFVISCSFSRLTSPLTDKGSISPPGSSPLPTGTVDINSLIQTQSLWISPAVPPALTQAASSYGIPIDADPASATLRLELDPDQNSAQSPGSTWIYALVAPFATVLDGVGLDELQECWSGSAGGALLYSPVWMDETTLAALKTLWGDPNPAFWVRTAPQEALLDSAWSEQPSYAIISFEAIEPRWKVLGIDGQSPLHKDFDPETYPLKIRFSLSGPGTQLFNLDLPVSNRDPQKLTTLVMTGVTALVRSTALKMEQNGRLYPGEAIRDWLVNADVTHISNEIAFSPDCPYPDAFDHGLIFCSNPLNIELLEYVGTDIVELTGNHFQDWGSDATLLTLEMYKQRNWSYFGGGANLEDARKSITIEHNGNRLAFIGCNPAGPDFAWATESQPGAAPCDWGWVKGEIMRLRSEGYLPIMTFQYYESYSVYPGAGQIADFRMMAEAGAVIVSGSQAHLPETIEFYDESFVHYGLGNLFFDQMDFPVVGTRREFLDRHVFYNGKYINTELLTALLEDYSRPRPMTEAERGQFLTDIFKASGW